MSEAAMLVHPAPWHNGGKSVMRSQRTPEQRFWSNVDKSGPVPEHAPHLGPCWIWNARTNMRGYGVFKLQGAPVLTHRMAWAFARGPIPKGMSICHHCDNPPCVRTDHLFLGTHKDNMDDMARKGRRGRRIAVGQANSRAILTERDVLDIRKSTESHAALALRYHVAPSSIFNVRARITWRHI